VIQVMAGDLAEVAADAVLRPADAMLEPAGAVSQRLDVRAGERYADQRRIQDPLDVGAAVVTGAGDLAAEFVLHCVIRSAERAVSPDVIRRALASAWHRAEGWQLGRIAAPPVGQGLEGIGLEEAVGILVQSFRDRPSATGFPAELRIVVDTAEAAEAVRHLIGTAG
jgi:O-acetyl-ADP-ribose deacetylase